MTAGVLVSGKLGYICFLHLLDRVDIAFVLTDKGSQSIIETCQNRGIAHFIGNPRNGKANEFLAKRSAEIILSVNYLFIVDKDILELPSLYAINLHGSLLPKYRGRTPHVWAIINGESEVGVTAHLMTEGCDEGDIVVQNTVEVNPEDTGADVLKKYEIAYPVILNDVIEAIENNTLSPLKQDHIKATFFGKRTPEDGEINWDWCRERIQNWIRAQADPYPGAFTYYQNQKVIVHKAEPHPLGFNDLQPNGIILEVVSGGEALVVKTPNGAIKLSGLKADAELSFSKNQKLNGRD